MGFPLSTLRQLADLCREKPFIRETFDRYRVVAVVVHGPGPGGKRFKRTIKDNFERLHETTGSSFAFISFIDPPREWKARHRNWIEDRERLAAGEGCEDEDFFRALQGRFDLPDAPCLILTDNLLSNDYLILLSSPEKVVSQMEAIGQYALAREGRFPVCGDGFIRFATTLGAVSSHHISDGESLAGDIAALLAIRSLDGKGTVPDRFAQEDQRDLARTIVRRELNSLRDARLRTNEMDGDQAQKALDRQSDYLALVAQKEQSCKPSCRSSSKYPIKNITVENDDIWPSCDGMYSFMVPVDVFRKMEPLSQFFIKNYLILLPVCFGQPSPFGEYFDPYTSILQNEGVDFAPLGNYLGKAVEEEVNASVIQLVRRTLGVGMPAFFRRYEDDLDDCTVITKNKSIHFNLKGRQLDESVWQDRTIPLGDSVFAIRTIIQKEHLRDALGTFGDEDYLNNANWFARHRNQACHNGMFDLESFKEMYRLFSRLMNSYMMDIVHLKRVLSGSE